MTDEAAGRCPKCHAPVEPDAVICVGCGRHLGLGIDARTVAHARAAGRTGLAVAVGAGAALAGGVVWAVIGITTGFEVGYVAWAVGLIAAFAVLYAGAEPGIDAAVLAAGLAIVGLLVGKLIIFQWHVGPVAEELARNPDFLAGVLFEEAARENAASDQELAGWLDRESGDRAPNEGVTAKLQAIGEEVRKRLDAMSKEERCVLAAAKADEMLSRMSYWQRIRAKLSPLDMVWFLLASGAAFWCVARASPSKV